MYYLFVLLLLAATSAKSYAQPAGMLTGTVTDEKNAGVGFVNVAVVNTAGSVVTGAIADLEGSFQIISPAQGTYSLKITGLGYQTLQTQPFEVTGSNFTKDFGRLQLKADVKTLKEVTVQAMRPTITTEPDKMVVSVEGTALASGSTAYEVLEKAPGVWIDQDGNIRLNGKDGVQIMIDGKKTYLSGKELQNLLQGMAAENLKDLEIITNPSARYEAEGSSGIININLKKNQVVGMSGSVYGGYQYNRLSTYTSGAELNHKNGKWNTSASLDLARRMRFRDMQMNRVFVNEDGNSSIDQDGYEEIKHFAPALRLSSDYDLNKQHSVGVMANLQYNASENRFSTDSYLRRPNTADNQYIRSVNDADSEFQNGNFNLHYVGKLDTLGTNLSADLDYVKISDRTDFEFLNLRTSINADAPTLTELLTSHNPTAYDIYSAKVDFTKVLSKVSKLELGAKASHVVSDNELKFYEVTETGKQLDDKRSSHFIYNENIYAAYANLSTKLGTTWSLTAGLRAEQTNTRGNSISKNKITDRDYLDLFPSVFLQQQVNENYQIGYKYSRRINRPYYEHLNPFIFYIDKYTTAQGNPYLKPSYTNAFELTQTLKKSYNLVLGYNLTTDFIAEVPFYNSKENITVFMQSNVDKYTNLTANLVAPVRISGKWEMNNNATLAYQRFSLNLNESTVLNDQIFFTVQSNQNIQLPKDIRMEVSASYQGPAVYGLYTLKSMWGVDAGFKRSFLNDKLTLSMNVTDIFKTRVMKINTSLDGNTNAIDQYHGAQSVRLNLRYRFNKGKEFEAKKRNNSLDELNRTGN